MLTVLVMPKFPSVGLIDPFLPESFSCSQSFKPAVLPDGLEFLQLTIYDLLNSEPVSLSGMPLSPWLECSM